MKIIIDSNNIAHIALYACAMNDDNCEDEQVQGLFYHLFMLKANEIFGTYNPRDVWFSFDNYKGSSARKELSPVYKANRKAVGAKPFIKVMYKILLPTLKELISLYPTNIIESENGETDDIAYGLCNKFKDEDSVEVISGDSDLLQLMLQFDNVKVYNPRKKIYENKPDPDYVKLKSIIGDSSDCIGGVKGVGPKNAFRYLNGEKTFNDKQKEEYEDSLKLIDLSLYIRKDKIAEEIDLYIKNKEYSFKPDDIEYFLFENSMKTLYDKWPSLKETILKYGAQ